MYYIGDNVALVRDTSVKGRIHHFDGDFVWIEIGEELIPMLEKEITLTKSNGEGLLLVVVVCLVFLFLVV